VALVAASVLVGARLLGGADDTIEVWAASGDLAAGQPVTEGDLVVRRVHFDDEADAGRYLRVGEDLPDQGTLARSVGEGELVPARAFGVTGGGLLEVPIAIVAEALPASVDPGSTVDVYVTDADRREAELVLDDVVVIAVPGVDEAFGPGGNRQVLVGVPEDAEAGIGVVLAAAQDGRVSIAREG
jgi:hypothetical protein